MPMSAHGFYISFSGLESIPFTDYFDAQTDPDLMR